MNTNNEFFLNSMISVRKDNDEWRTASETSNANLTEKTITENGTYNAKDDNADGYSKVTVDVVGSVSFSATPTNFSLVGNIDNLHVVVPEGVTKIADYAFYISIYMGDQYPCPGLKSVVLPSTLTEIGFSSFSSCTGLTEITIPDSVTTIKGGAFEDCTGLTEITISDSATTIGQWFLEGCSNLASVTFKSTTPPSLEGPLDIPTSCVIRVPAGALTAYTTAEKYPSPDEYTYEEY